MTNGEIAYLVLAIGTFLVYSCLLAYGMAVASERPAELESKQAGNAVSGSSRPRDELGRVVAHPSTADSALAPVVSAARQRF